MIHLVIIGYPIKKGILLMTPYPSKKNNLIKLLHSENHLVKMAQKKQMLKMVNC